LEKLDAQQHLSERLAVRFQQSGVGLKPTVLRPTKFTEEALTKVVVGIGQLPVSDPRDRIRVAVVGQIVNLNTKEAPDKTAASAEVAVDEGTDELSAAVRLAMPVTGATLEESEASAIARGVNRKLPVEWD
jgi:hypothetical protein